ncbi:MAG: alpha/beta hydrolase-fold protein [Candidatus Poribacteria bacterium]
MKKRIIQSILVLFCILLTVNYASAQDGKILRITVHSPSLEGNLFKDSPDRDVTVYLPPSYDNDPGMRYPVVYLLHGYSGNDTLWTGGSYIKNGNIKDWIKSWLKDGKVKEMILVMPNSYNIFMGSCYTNSSATGKWADYIAKDLIEYIDSHWALRQRESRAVIGHSMGGYGGIKLGMLYPEVFGCIGGMAGVWDTEDGFNVDPSSYAIASEIKNWAEFNSAGFWIKSSFSDAGAYAPNPDNPPFYCDFPFIYTDTQPKEMVKNQKAYDKFMEHDLFVMLDKHIDALQSMKAIYIDAGINDQLIPIKYPRKFHERLENVGIKHIYNEFSGDHTCCVMNSTGNALEVFSKAMAFEMLTSVEPKGKVTSTWGEIRRGK